MEKLRQLLIAGVARKTISGPSLRCDRPYAGTLLRLSCCRVNELVLRRSLLRRLRPGGRNRQILAHAFATIGPELYEYGSVAHRVHAVEPHVDSAASRARIKCAKFDGAGVFGIERESAQNVRSIRQVIMPRIHSRVPTKRTV